MLPPGLGQSTCRETCGFITHPTLITSSPPRKKEPSLQVIHQRCCGLDVHKKTVVACILITAADGSVQKQTRPFSTMTVSLLTLVDWLDAWQITHVAQDQYRRVLAGGIQSARRGA
jgi:hypothetical protein